MFKIISRNLIQKRTEDINIHKEKQNNLITRFKTNTICKFFVVIIEGINKRHNPYPYMTCSRPVNYRGFQTRSAFCEFSEVVESFTIFYSKEEDGLTSYFILDVLEAKIFRYMFMEGHNV